MNTEELIQNVLNDVHSFHLEDIPNIDLYMDQVTTYLNNKFDSSKRYEDDKLLTKTMINNYAKSRLLPAPEKKKYTKDHMIVLALIFFFKNVISINDVTILLKPLLDKHFHNEEEPLEDIVNMFLTHVKNSDMSEPILKEFKDSIEIFSASDAEDKEYLQTLGLISMFSYDMFIRKMIIEKLIDSLPINKDKKEEQEKVNKKDSKKENSEKKKEAD